MLNTNFPGFYLQWILTNFIKYKYVNLKLSSGNEIANTVTNHVKMLLFHSDYNIYEIGTQTIMQIWTLIWGRFFFLISFLFSSLKWQT